MSTLTVHSWNVNGLRACHSKGFANWLHGAAGEVVAVQEVRAQPEQLPEDLRTPTGWHTQVVAAHKAGYSGVGLFSRLPIDEVKTSLGEDRFDHEGRLQIARIGKLWVVNGYFPNGTGSAQRDNSRIPYKLAFYQKVFDTLRPQFEAGEPIVVLGDFNTAPHEIDLARPKQNVTTSGFTPEERAEVHRWLAAGWVDTFRHFHPQREGAYSWWSQRFGVREKNIGWRIDLALASPGLMPYLRGADVHPEVMGSDHCPISVTLDRAATGE